MSTVIISSRDCEECIEKLGFTPLPAECVLCVMERLILHNERG